VNYKKKKIFVLILRKYIVDVKLNRFYVITQRKSGDYITSFWPSANLC
jgi:predicted nucleic-acid-binding Zn-ribbon protein